jgi:membrane-bound serine protease (ClpP class)
MRQLLRGVALGCASLAIWVGAAGGEPEKGRDLVYIIPIHGEIERALVYVIRRGLNEAVRDGASAVILDMDTPGGRLDATEEILTLVGGVKIPTYTYVNPNAFSAGAIIAMATDHIYMAPGSRIGAAAPIMISPTGGGVEKMPDKVEEKMVSATASLIRSVAERKGHDSALAEGMVRSDGEYKIGDEVIKKDKQLLTLTSKEAERKVKRGDKEENLLSDGTVESLDALLSLIGRGGSERRLFKITGAERLARWIEAFSFIFLLGGVLGIYIEFKTPGFGLPGILGGILIAIWFWGHHVAGLAGMGEVLLFMVGVILLAVEIFIFPTLGIIGIAGAICMVVALFMAMVGRFPGGPVLPPFPDMKWAAINLLSSIVSVFVIGFLLSKFLPKTPLYGYLVLGTEEKSDKGFESAKNESSLLGRRGVLVTDLRPAGVATIGDRRVDVVGRGEYVGKGTTVVVAEVHGSRIVVEPVSDGLSGSKV